MRLEVYPDTSRALERRINDVQQPFSSVETAMKYEAQRLKKLTGHPVGEEAGDESGVLQRDPSGTWRVATRYEAGWR